MKFNEKVLIIAVVIVMVLLIAVLLILKNNMQSFISYYGLKKAFEESSNILLSAV